MFFYTLFKTAKQQKLAGFDKNLLKYWDIESLKIKMFR